MYVQESSLWLAGAALILLGAVVGYLLSRARNQNPLQQPPASQPAPSFEGLRRLSARLRLGAAPHSHSQSEIFPPTQFMPLSGSFALANR